MKYKTFKELSEVSGKSRYQIRRAIEAGIISREWLWQGPGKHKRVRDKYWHHCLDALDRGWGHSDQALSMSHEAKRRRAGECPEGEPVRASHRDALEGRLMTHEEVARAAGVSVEVVEEAVRTGRIPAHYTATEDPVPIGEKYVDVVNDTVDLIREALLEHSPDLPLETTVMALLQLGLIWGGDLDDIERRRVCGGLSNAAANGALENWARFDIPCEFTFTPIRTEPNDDQDPPAQPSAAE